MSHKLLKSPMDFKPVTKKRKKRKVPHIGQQVLKSLHIENLKGINGIDISFDGSPITGIFGLNGCGKTTILQTITCLYRADNKGENTKMSRFFKYTDDKNKWLGSNYSATFNYYDYSLKESIFNKTVNYKKIKPRGVSNKSEWSPRQAAKLNREVYYIPLSQCIPDIEKADTPRVTFRVSPKEIDIAEKITKAMSDILGGVFSSLQVAETETHKCFVVKKGKITCHSFNLGAGEQRIARFLKILYSAKEYSLIVIDELDLTLHTAALIRLIKLMLEEAKNKHLQIIFSSHRQELMDVKDINIRYIHKTEDKTLCINNPTSICYDELIGIESKLLHIFVEDDIAEGIVKKVLKECGVFLHGKVHRFGSITNSCNIAAGIACTQDDFKTYYLVCNDGDILTYVGKENLRVQMNKSLSGNDELVKKYREKALEMCSFFNADYDGALLSPEMYIRKSILELGEERCYTDGREIYSSFKSHPILIDKHDHLNILFAKDFEIGDVIALFAKNKKRWEAYTSNLRKWINKVKIEAEMETF